MIKILETFYLIRLCLKCVIMFFILFSIAPYSIWAKTPSQSVSRTLESEDIYKEIDIFTDALGHIKNEYVKDVKSKDLIYGALHGMLSSLDSHSQFLEPKLHTDVRNETQGTFSGIGLEVANDNGHIIVVTPLQGTPADRAGILTSDRILKIDEKSTKGLTLSEAVDLMRGEKGTKVHLVVYRESMRKAVEFVIIRDIIQIDSVKDAIVMRGSIGYIKIAEFQKDTTRELSNAIKQLGEDQLKGLILDLRNNPGGLFDAAIDVSDLFIDQDKLIVSTKSRIADHNIEFKSMSKVKFPANIPIVCLINQGSASAAEILAGALKDHNRAIIVGEQSFGKASVQAVIPLRDNSAIKLSVASYYTPNGTLISDSGITPDIKVKKQDKNKTEKKLLTGEKHILGQTAILDNNQDSDHLILEDNQVRTAYDALRGAIFYDAQDNS